MPVPSTFRHSSCLFHNTVRSDRSTARIAALTPELPCPIAHLTGRRVTRPDD
jgi:hypothetical protein